MVQYSSLSEGSIDSLQTDGGAGKSEQEVDTCTHIPCMSVSLCVCHSREKQNKRVSFDVHLISVPGL